MPPAAWVRERTVSICGTSTSTSGVGPPGRSSTSVMEKSRVLTKALCASSQLLDPEWPGFHQVRAYLRETCDDIWVIDCSPEGHQPELNTRIFQGVQQPICIVMASRSGKKTAALGAVHFQALPEGKREQKFAALKVLRLTGKAWTACPEEARAPFLPASTRAWSDFPKLEELFLYNGSGVMPGRTWVIAPDTLSLEKRCQRLISAPLTLKEALFQ